MLLPCKLFEMVTHEANCSSWRYFIYGKGLSVSRARSPLTYPLGADPETCLATEVHFHLIHHGQTDNQKVITVAWHHHTLQEDRVIEQCRREDSSTGQGQGIMNARCLSATGERKRERERRLLERDRERERKVCVFEDKHYHKKWAESCSVRKKERKKDFKY